MAETLLCKEAAALRAVADVLDARFTINAGGRHVFTRAEAADAVRQLEDLAAVVHELLTGEKVAGSISAEEIASYLDGAYLDLGPPTGGIE